MLATCCRLTRNTLIVRPGKDGGDYEPVLALVFGNPGYNASLVQCMKSIWTSERPPSETVNKQKSVSKGSNRGPCDMFGVGTNANIGTYGKASSYVLKSSQTLATAKLVCDCIWGVMKTQFTCVGKALSSSRVTRVPHANLTVNAPFQSMFSTRNSSVNPHVDKNDEDGSVIFWGADGDVKGGFIIYNYLFGIELIGMTVLYIRTQELTHGSVAPTGNGTLYGSALASRKGVVGTVVLQTERGEIPLERKIVRGIGAKAKPEKAKLEKAKPQKAKPQKAKLEKAKLEKARLEKAKLEKAKKRR